MEHQVEIKIDDIKYRVKISIPLTIKNEINFLLNKRYQDFIISGGALYNQKRYVLRNTHTHTHTHIYI